jgi:hypothetical protein
VTREPAGWLIWEPSGPQYLAQTRSSVPPAVLIHMFSKRHPPPAGYRQSGQGSSPKPIMPVVGERGVGHREAVRGGLTHER